MISCRIFATVFPFKVLETEVHNTVVKILSSEVSVTSSRLHLENAIIDGKQRHVESAATHVIYQDISLATAFSVQTIRDGCCSRFIDYPQHIHAGNRPRIFCCLALGVIEVGWHCNHSIVNLAAQVSLSCLFDFEQNHGGYF